MIVPLFRPRPLPDPLGYPTHPLDGRWTDGLWRSLSVGEGRGWFGGPHESPTPYLPFSDRDFMTPDPPLCSRPRTRGGVETFYRLRHPDERTQ